MHAALPYAMAHANNNLNKGVQHGKGYMVFNWLLAGMHVGMGNRIMATMAQNNRQPKHSNNQKGYNMAKAAKAIGQFIVQVMAYPNAPKGYTNFATISVNGQATNFGSGKQHAINLYALGMPQPLTAFFVAIGNAMGKANTQWQFGFKNAYLTAFGITPKSATTAYKCVVANHAQAGLNNVCFNAGHHATPAMVMQAIAKNGLTVATKGNTWATVHATTGNHGAMVACACQLLGLPVPKATGKKVAPKATGKKVAKPKPKKAQPATMPQPQPATVTKT